MKKAIALFMVTLLVVMSAACSGGTQNQSQNVDVTINATEAATTAAPAAETTTEAATEAETTAAAQAAETTTAAAAETTAAVTEQAVEEEDDAGYTKFSGEIVISIIDEPGNPTTKIDYLREAYAKYQPNVQIIWEPQTSNQYSTWLTTQLASGSIRPDLVCGNYSPNAVNYVNFNLYRNRVNPYTGNVWQDELNFDLINERNTKGEKIMLPSEAVHILWFYNKDIFDEVGVQPPTTDVEFVDICEKLLAAGYTPFAANFAWQVPQWFVEIYGDQFMRSYDEYLRAQPGDWCYDEELDGNFVYDPNDPNLGSNYTYSAQRQMYNIKNRNYLFDGPKFIAWATAYQKMFNAKYNWPEFSVSNDHYANFLIGKTGMMPNGTGTLTGLQRDLASITPERKEALNLDADTEIQAFNWGTFENPGMTGDMVEGPVRSIESASGVYLSVIKKDQEHIDMCIDFVHFWLSQEGYQAWVDGQIASPQGYSPSGPLQIKGVVLPAELQSLVDNIHMMGNAEYPGKHMISFAGWDNYQYCSDLLLELLQQNITPEAYAKSMQDLFDDNFDEIVSKGSLTMEDIDYPERKPAE